jgi:crotonobetainyl-CoA:carnitine CoA-transferase CaiB-like acyl-CoA transferase
MNILDKWRVLDLTDEKGMFCSKLLADMGAEVLRIEKPGADVPAVYANTGKHSLSLNIEMEKGRELLRRIIPETAVVIESYRPGYLDSLALGYPELSRINPGLVMVSITDFGQTGPYRDYKSSDLVASALGGSAAICGEPGQPPLKPFGQQAYSTAGLFAANGILLAAWGRQHNRQNQYLDISIHECMAATLDHVLVRYFYAGQAAQRRGSLYWNNAFRIFFCRDGPVLLSLFHQWETLIEWLDSEGMAEDLTAPGYRDEAVRRENLDHIIAVLEKWTLKHTVRELVEPGQLMRFPWAEVASIPQVVDSPQLKERGYWVETADPDTGQRYKFPGAPVRLSGSPWQVHPLLPRRGDYNLEIYQRRLGLSEAEIEQLAQEEVI